MVSIPKKVNSSTGTINKANGIAITKNLCAHREFFFSVRVGNPGTEFIQNRRQSFGWEKGALSGIHTASTLILIFQYENIKFKKN
jgi:hypothetical protein